MYRFVDSIPDENCFRPVWNEYRLFLLNTLPSLTTRKGNFALGWILRPEFEDLWGKVTLPFPPMYPVAQDGRMAQESLSRFLLPVSCIISQHTFSSNDILSLKLQDRIKPIMIRKSFMLFFWAKLHIIPNNTILHYKQNYPLRNTGRSGVERLWA